MYTIGYDDRTRILTIKLQSFWTRVTLARFLAEATARGLTLLMRNGRIAVFVDCSEFQIQSAEVASGFLPLIGRAARRGVPIVLIPHSPLGKLQADRLLGGTGVGIFLDLAEGRDWLVARMADRARAA